MPTPALLSPAETLLDRLTAAQREAVTHSGGPLLIIAGAGTGKTTVITRRIAWLLNVQNAPPESVLALTFTEKAAAEMAERIDLLVPYGYLDVAVRTFHAFGDVLLREHALSFGLSRSFRVLSQAEQLVFLREHVFDLPLEEFRPLNDPTRFLEALLNVFARAKDEAVGPEEFLAYAQRLAQEATACPSDAVLAAQARRTLELANAYGAYQTLLHQADAIDFGDQVLLALQLLEHHPEIRTALHQRLAHVFVDEFQDTNYAQFRLLQLLAPPEARITVVADDDQSIYKWRGAAISNVIKFLDHYVGVRTIVLTENFRSPQPLLDAAYRLIRFNDPDRLEVRQGIDKRLVARASASQEPPHLQIFDTVSSEADWVAKTIRQEIESGARRPNDFAILVRSNREADLFLRALNVEGVPWQFSGASGLFARQEVKMLVSCLRALADPEDSLSWYHVASSALYRCPMSDLVHISSEATRSHGSFRAVLARLPGDGELAAPLSAAGQEVLLALRQDVERLVEASREHSAGQLLYRWLSERGWLALLSRETRAEEALQLQTTGKFFQQLRRIEELVGGSLPEVIKHLQLFQAMGNEAVEEDDAWADRVKVLTLHKAKGLEFPVIFMVGLVQGRFPTPHRKDPIELPEALIKDILPAGDYHLQEERRLFYVGMTRAQETLHLTCAYDYGGRTVRKVSQFAVEALNLPSPNPAAQRASARELIERSRPVEPIAVRAAAARSGALRLDPHGVDDYLTCPLKYRYSHVLRVPAMRHHVVVYGAALHKAVEEFFRRRLAQQPMTEEELLGVFDRHWSTEGFLTKEHERLRKEQGRATLRRFFQQQQTQPELPSLIEAKFRILLDDVLLVGRWDRVDQREDGTLIIDYKSSEVREQAAADRRTRDSLQLLVYAIAWRKLHGELPIGVELRFLETGLTGRAQFTEDDLARGVELIHEAAAGIRAGQFQAKPQEFSCRWCAFQTVCPAAFRAR